MARTAMALSLIALVVILALTVTRLLLEPSPERAPATLASRPPEPSYVDVPPREVRDMHRALHGLGDACAETGVDQSAVEAQVSALLAFARRHPDGRFAIDDENGTSLSLLLVVQDELRTCAPDLLPRVQDLLPDEMRRPR